MTIEVEVGGRRHAVDVRREGDRWLIGLDGRQLSVSVTEAGERWSLLVGSRSHEVSFESGAAGEHVVHVDGYSVPVTILSGPGSPNVGTKGRRRQSEAAAAAGPRPIVAPMPGRIVKVLVRRGDIVEPRQGLVVVEAMKMENELRAPRAGTVTDVRVTEGMSVEAHAVLVVIE